ncbi:MAG: hypothetical protein PWP67_2291 [Clostridium butyricum]|jgi:hypothetical protein|nr:hypothetical protein [Clostridium butyricum]NOW25207.1 hypothetical protein [Clostridium butyricum]
MLKKRLPYGQSSYKSVVNDDFIYVDKTSYIEKLENLHDTFVFF